MKVTKLLNFKFHFAALTLLVGATALRANTELWIGVSGVSTTTNWSDTLNWTNTSGGGSPGPNGNDVVFGDTGATNSAGIITSVANQNLLNPLSLTFTNGSVGGGVNYQTIYVPNGISITNAGSFTVGRANLPANNYVINAVWFGEGTLVQSGVTMTVDNSSSTASGGALPTLDMSGLSNFVAGSINTLNIAGSGSESRGAGQLNLAAKSFITATNITMNTHSGNNASTGSTINLGLTTNSINTTNVVLGQTKGNTSKIQFFGSTGTLRMRGVTGADGDRGVTILLGDRNNTGSGTTAGQLLFDGHFVDVKASSITVGMDRSGTGSSSHAGSGTVSFDTGTIDVTGINMAVSTSGGTVSSASGTVTVGGTGTLIVGSAGISMGNKSGGSTGATATLNVNGGTVNSSGNITKTNAGAVATINMNTGSLIVAAGKTVGTSGIPIDNIGLSDSTNTYTPSAVATVYANSLTTGGGGNVINVAALPVITTYPAQYPLIQYNGGIGGSGFNFTLGTLPASSPAYVGYISNNATSVDLVLTSGPVPVGVAVWSGAVNSNWDTTTLNWTNTGVAAVFNQGDATLFNDTAINGATNINLTTNLSPGSLVISNVTKPYVFSGSGKITGGTGLAKKGPGVLIIANSGINDFLGGVTNGAGTLQIGNNDANGNIPAGLLQNDAAVVFARSDSVTLPNTVSGIGALAQNGTGILTLTAANDYSGVTTVRNGTLALSGGGSIANSPLISVGSGGTFDVSGIANASFSASAVSLTNNATLALGLKTAAITTLTASNSTISLAADLNGVTLTATSLITGGTTNFINITGVANVPPLPTLPVIIPLITYGSATFNGGFNFGETSFPNAYVSNDVVTSTIYLVLTAEPYIVTWNGGSATGNNWSDVANWTGVTIGSRDSLVFNGVARLNNTNDTAAGTTYSNITFNSGSGAFTLNGNTIQLGGNISNNSVNAQTILLGVTFRSNSTLNAVSGPLIIGGGITNNTTVGSSTLTLAGTGFITNLMGSVTPGGTNLLLMNDAAATWTLLDNPASTTNSTPWAFAINNGTFNFGSATSAPKLTSTSAQGVPQDNQIGQVANSTGVLNISNGVFTTSARMNTGLGGGATGIVNVVNATLNVASQFQGANGANTAVGFLNVGGGTVNIGSAANPNGILYVASRGAGTLNMNGGILNCGILDTTRNAAGNTGPSTGIINLNAGLLTVTSVTNVSANAQTATTPTAQFNFNGGTLRARTNFAYRGSTTSPAVPITSYAQTGGAVIDTAGFNVGFFETLDHDPALVGVADGGLVKLGSGTLTMSAASTYNGNTVISNGTLNVSGSLGNTAVRVVGGTLSGTGSVNSNVTVNAGGAISPAGSGTIGTLTIANNLVLQGSTMVDVDQTSLTSDLLSVAGSVSYGGTLVVTNLTGTLGTNDSFQLFSASAYGGAFSGFNPATPGAGLAWNTNTLTTDGILRVGVGSTVNTTPTNIVSSRVGNNLTLSWPADHIGWKLLVQTNTRAVGLNTNWFEVTDSATTNQVTVPISGTAPTVFYRLTYP